MKPLLWPILCSLAVPALADNPSPPPNIIVILADDLGYADLGVQGSTDIRTPHIDSLARSGTRFTDAYVTCTICAPSRAALVTGRYQQRFGFEDIGGPQPAPEFGLPPEEVTIAKYLQGGGYATAIIGKWDLGQGPDSLPNNTGFDTFFGFLPGANDYIRRSAATESMVNGRRHPIFRNRTVVDEPEYLTDAFGREAERFIKQHAHQPFFLYLSFSAPHTPMEATEPYLDRFPDLYGGRRVYAAMVSAMDVAVGRVLAALESANLQENTLIIFLSDNGGASGARSTVPNFSDNRPLRGYKATYWEGGVRVPFIISWPARVRPNEVSAELISSLDILPTALAAAGIEPWADQPLDGQDLLPLLGEQPSPVAAERTLYWRYFENTSIRSGPWKLLRIGGLPVQLFNVVTDISESKEVSSTHPEVTLSLARKLDDWAAGLQPPRWQRRFVDENGNVSLMPLPVAQEHISPPH